MPPNTIRYVLPILACFACSPIDESSVYGRYRSNIEIGEETLEISRDGTYLHLYKQESGDATNRGNWRFYQNGDDTRLVFQDFKFTPVARGKVDGEWPAVVDRCGFSICIRIAIDTGYRFERERD